MTNKKKARLVRDGAKNAADSDTAGPPKKTRESVKKWAEMQRELDDKLKELLYEDRNGFKPPKPWYED